MTKDANKLNNALQLLYSQRDKAILLLKERHGEDFSQPLASKFKGSSKLFSDISWPINDPDVKSWYFETISLLENSFGKANDCLKRLKKLRNELLIDDIHFVDGEFNTFHSGELLKFSLDLLNDCILKIEKDIEIIKKINTGHSKTEPNLGLKTKTLQKRKFREKCPKPVREALWKKYFGNSMEGKCLVCETQIKFTDFEASHNTPHIDGGNWHIDNLRPCCRTCNRSMGTMPVDEFKQKFFKK